MPKFTEETRKASKEKRLKIEERLTARKTACEMDLEIKEERKTRIKNANEEEIVITKKKKEEKEKERGFAIKSKRVDDKDIEMDLKKTYYYEKRAWNYTIDELCLHVDKTIENNKRGIAEIGIDDIKTMVGDNITIVSERFKNSLRISMYERGYYMKEKFDEDILIFGRRSNENQTISKAGKTELMVGIAIDLNTDLRLEYDYKMYSLVMDLRRELFQKTGNLFSIKDMVEMAIKGGIDYVEI